MVFCAIRFVMIIFRPHGIFPARRRERELVHAGDEHPAPAGATAPVA